MKCVVPSQNVKVLAKTLHSLGKIGDDLFIEPHLDHLTFQTVNMAESAYASFTFTTGFFSSFTFGDKDNEESLRCKIAMKSLLLVLKSPHGERLVEWCQIRVDPNETKVIFQLRYSYGCTKTHFLPILESEMLQVNYSKEDCDNRLSASAKLLSTAVKNFRVAEDEVTLHVMPQKLIMKNHLENSLDSKKAVRTEICLFPEEFEAYTIAAPTSVTFCLKELRAVLFFAEFTGLPVQFYISSAGKPVVFVVNHEAVYEANYVVSTLNEAGESQPASQSSGSSAATSVRRVAENAKKRSWEEPKTPERNGLDAHPHPECSNRLNSANQENSCKADGLDDSAVPLQFSEPTDISKCSLTSNVTQPVVKNVFGRCFNITFKKQCLQGNDKVLAYDSDGMEDSD